MPTVSDARLALQKALLERDLRILRLVDAGMTYDYIARAEGLTRARVEQIVRRRVQEAEAAPNGTPPAPGG